MQSRCVIFNPAAKGNKAAQFRRHLDELKDCTLMATVGPGSARELAAVAIRGGFRTIVAAGGDGTINEVLNGMGDVPHGFEQSRLAILPLGTVNVFAKEFNIPTKLRAAWRIVDQGNSASIDLPEITYQADGGEHRRYFVQMAGAGLDARAVELVSWPLKKRIGSLAYIWAAAQALSRPQANITVQTENASAAGEWIIVGNGKFYAGRFAFCPRAEYADGLLDICVFHKVSWMRLLMHALALLTNRMASSELSAHFQAREIRLTSESVASVQVDGEAAGQLPATIRVHPKKLRLIVP